jgi:hypothetical protein
LSLRLKDGMLHGDFQGLHGSKELSKISSEEIYQAKINIISATVLLSGL